MTEPNIRIVPTDKLPTREEHTWSYSLLDLDHIFEQIEDGTRDNNETFLLYNGRLYEMEETQVGL